MTCKNAYLTNLKPFFALQARRSQQFCKQFSTKIWKWFQTFPIQSKSKSASFSTSKWFNESFRVRRTSPSTSSAQRNPQEFLWQGCHVQSGSKVKSRKEIWEHKKSTFSNHEFMNKYILIAGWPWQVLHLLRWLYPMARPVQIPVKIPPLRATSLIGNLLILNPTMPHQRQDGGKIK